MSPKPPPKSLLQMPRFPPPSVLSALQNSQLTPATSPTPWTVMPGPPGTPPFLPGLGDIEADIAGRRPQGWGCLGNSAWEGPAGVGVARVQGDSSWASPEPRTEQGRLACG